jgi:phage repressor protein C with HTH and peptisase S24 domain
VSRINFVLNELLDKGEVSFKPHGNSMTPKIKSGEQVKLKRIEAKNCRVGDAVYCKVKGTYYLHLLTAIDKDRYQISNNHGHVNGWIREDAIFGICVEAGGKVLISEEELKNRN